MGALTESPFSAACMYGAGVQIPDAATPTAHMGSDDAVSGWKGLLDFRSNPLPWVGVILLVTVGAIGVAGSVRLGRAQLSASVGEK